MRIVEENWWTPRSWLTLLGATLSAVVGLEGLGIMYVAAPTYIEGIGGILERTVLLGGVQLFMLGIYLFLYWTLKDRFVLGRNIFGGRAAGILALFVTLLVIVEGAVLAFQAGDLRIEGIGGIRKFWMVGGGCQLFFLGLVLLFAWIVRWERGYANWARATAFACGGTVAAEGLFIVGNSVPIDIEGIGGITSATVSMVGTQLLLLGIILAFLWAFRGISIRGKEYLASFPFNVIPLLVSEIIAGEGLILAAYASSVNVTGLGGIREFWVVAAGTQLFFLGTLASLAWLWRERKPWGSRASTIPSLFASCALMAEGVFIMGVAAPIVVESIGGMLSRTVMLAGVQLFVLGLLTSLYWILKDRTVFGRDIATSRVIRFTPLAVGAVVAIEGVVLIAYKSVVTLEGVGVIRGAWMVLAGSQLLFLGLVIALSWFWKDETPMDINLTRVMEIFLAALVISEGVFLMGNAANVRFNEFGGVGGFYVAASGASLLLLGGSVLLIRKIGDIEILKREIVGFPLSQLLIFCAWILIGIEGMVLASLASNMWIEGFGGLSFKYVLAAALQLFAVALIGLLFWIWRNKDLRYRVRQIATMLMIFLALILAPAVLF